MPGSRLESLPSEILLQIISFLDPLHITKLQLLSKRLLEICRDDSFWRARCLLESSFLEGINLRRGSRLSDALYSDPLLRAVTFAQDNHEENGDSPTEPLSSEWISPQAIERERVRITANWDPTFPGEKVSWYDEYIHRNAPIAVNWLEAPTIRDGGLSDAIEVRGTALYEPSPSTSELFSVSPLDDGSVCLWDVKGSRSKKGSIFAKSEAGLLCVDGPGTDLSQRSKMIGTGVTECVAVDNIRDRAFLAVQSRLIEVDLNTLQVTNNTPFEWSITTLSAAHPTVPLTVGTLHGIHLHDYRVPSKLGSQHHAAGPTDQVDDQPGLEISKILETPLAPYAPLAQSGPLSILHLEQPGSQELLSDDIFVAGRFSSILLYDRRMFKRIRGSIHSGASLSSLTSLPYPFSCVDSDLRRRGELSKAQVDQAKSIPGGRTLIACGGYNTKGSLEIYGLSSQAPARLEQSGVYQNSTMKNRQTASKSKLLSVINHGTRLLVSDGQGYLKWIERDGFTEVRRHKIGSPEKIEHKSIFASMPGTGELARKLLSTKLKRNTGASGANHDDVLFWTGEKLGLISFSSKPGFAAEDFEDDTRTPEEVAAERKEQLYGERMRLALERQANEVHFVRNLGHGVRSGF